MNVLNKNKLIVVCGPTAVGKTSLAIQLAKYYETEIISADSRQFYKEMNIGTAKPSIEELSEIKHHFINNLNVIDDYSSGSYANEVLQLLEEWYKKHTKPIIIAGGSGLFVKAVCEGFDTLPKVDEKTRAAINTTYLNEGITALQQKLEIEDAEYYASVDKNNPQRLIRALEVIESTGKPFSSFLKKAPKPRFFESIYVGLNINRALLYERINKRVDLMMQAGLLAEVEGLLNYRHLKALQTVGYTELFEFLDGKINKEQAIALIKQNTRRYAKRQITWFKKIAGLKWFQPLEVELIKEYINTKLD